MTPTIQLEITLDGEVKATVEGVAGPACADLSAFLDKLGEVAEDEPTDDFYQAVVQDDQLVAGQGANP